MFHSLVSKLRDTVECSFLSLVQEI